MDHLKAPIAGDDPFGIYLKGDKPTYRGLRNAFNAAQAAWRSLSETQESLENRDLAAANSGAWANLSDLCATCLTQTSKDLEILVWYTAAQVHSDRPLHNTAAALTVIADLVDESLDSLHPLPPADKLKSDGEQAQATEIAELRLRPFIQLVGEVEGSGLLFGPMTAHRLIGDLTYGKYILADKNGTLEAMRAQMATLVESGAEALLQTIEGLQGMQRQFDRLDAALKIYATQHGLHPPMIGYAHRLVSDILSAIQRLVEGSGFRWPTAENDATVSDPVEEGAQDNNTAEPVMPTSEGALTTGSVQIANLSNRNEALQAVARLATYFRTTEPHSPICLLLDRAVRWGSLSAGELYREILSDGSVGMAQMSLMTGLESQGFSDTFGSNNAGSITHPTLSDYAAAAPQPTTDSGPSNVAAEPVTVPESNSDTQIVGNETAQSPDNTAEAEPDLPVENFQW